eukprot:TRINITY_DN101313_c0_g1_i1.p1 TRINITY_DN101313_c0_g1~~TRINITY_DN101313_c0_g1_i1.p1  ORF type:complete len:249 (-),score=53.00 TRINITY_DN101313_c0_g1_i1:611-1357(-)
MSVASGAALAYAKFAARQHEQATRAFDDVGSPALCGHNDAFSGEIPLKTMETWMETPYAKYMEQMLRQKWAAERDQHILDIRNALGEERARHERTKAELEEAKLTLMRERAHNGDKMESMNRTIRECKAKLLKNSDRGASAGLLASVKGIAKDAIWQWYNLVLQKKLANALAPRPKPSVYQYQREMEEANAEGQRKLLAAFSQLQTQFLDQITAIGSKHVDVDKYVDGRPPGAQAEASVTEEASAPEV